MGVWSARFPLLNEITSVECHYCGSQEVAGKFLYCISGDFAKIWGKKIVKKSVKGKGDSLQLKWFVGFDVNIMENCFQCVRRSCRNDRIRAWSSPAANSHSREQIRTAMSLIREGGFLGKMDCGPAIIWAETLFQRFRMIFCRFFAKLVARQNRHFLVQPPW